MQEHHEHRDFIPRTDADLLVYAQTYLGAFTPLAVTTWGFTADEVTALTTAVTAYQTALDAAVDGGHTAIVTKNTARNALKHLLRSYTARIQAHPATTDPQRAALSITIRDKHPTTIETPVVYPHLLIEVIGYLQVRITFYFENSEHLGIPYGYHGAVLYFHIGDTAVTDFDLLNESRMMSESPFILHLTQEADLKTLSCSAAWEVSGGRQGPKTPIQSIQVR